MAIFDGAIFDAALFDASASSSLGTGSLSATIAAFTLSSNSVLPIKGTLAATIPAVTVSSASKLAIAGTVSSTLAPVTSSSLAVLPIKATLAANIDPVTAEATGVGPGVVTPVPRGDGAERYGQTFRAPAKSWRTSVDEIADKITRLAEDEAQDDRPKTRKVKREIAQTVTAMVGNGVLATSAPEVTQRVVAAITDNSLAERQEIYAAIREAIRLAVEQDDEEAAFILLAA